MAVKLNDKQVKSLLRKGEPGRYAAGHGLYLRVSNEENGFWVVRYSVKEGAGRSRWGHLYPMENVISFQRRA